MSTEPTSSGPGDGHDSVSPATHPTVDQEQSAEKKDSTESSGGKKSALSAVTAWTRRNFVKILLGAGGSAAIGGVGLYVLRGGKKEVTEHERIIKTMGYTRDDLAVMAAHQLNPEQCADAGVKGGRMHRAMQILRTQYGATPFHGLAPDQQIERLRETSSVLMEEEISASDSVFGKTFYERWMRPVALNGLLKGLHAFFQQKIDKYGKKELSPQESARKNRVGKELELERGEHALATRRGETEEIRTILDRIEQLETEFLTLEKKAKEGTPLPKYLKIEKDYMPIIQWTVEASLLIFDIKGYMDNRPTGSEMLLGWPYALGRMVDHYASIRLFLPGGETFKDLPTYARKGAMYGLVAALIILGGQKLGLQKLLPDMNRSPTVGAPTQPVPGGGTVVPSSNSQPDTKVQQVEEAPLTPDQKQKIFSDFKKNLGLPER